MCKGTQQFVHRKCLDHWRAVKVIAAIAGLAYLLDRGGKFRNRFVDGGDHIVSKHPVLFYYCVGVMVFLALFGLGGLLLHCVSSDNDIDPPCLAGPGCSYDCPDCGCTASGDASCLVLVIVLVVVFAIPGIIYGFIAATMAFKKIVERHYHILTKKELTKVYVVKDLHGSYATPPKMDAEHEQRLKMLHLM